MPKYLPRQIDGTDSRGIADLIRASNVVRDQLSLLTPETSSAVRQHFSIKAQAIENTVQGFPRRTGDISNQCNVA